MESAKPKNNTALILKKKQKQLRKLQDDILVLNDDISKRQKELRALKSDDLNSHVSSLRLKAHEKDIFIDSKKRPPDKANNIRNYGKLDNDIWKFDDIREWFNKYDSGYKEYIPTPAETGYMLKCD